MDRKKILSWEMWGILFITLAGSLLHFTFELSGKWLPMAVISGVNESTWEHFKIGFWPAFIWAFLEFFVFGRKAKNFFFAKGISCLTAPLVIAGHQPGAAGLRRPENRFADLHRAGQGLLAEHRHAGSQQLRQQHPVPTERLGGDDPVQPLRGEHLLVAGSARATTAQSGSDA